MERETRIELATNSLEGCDSTTELLPPKNSPQGSVVRDQFILQVEADSISSPRPYLTPDLCSLFPVILELMTGLEPVTSPLPRECSTN